MIVTDSSLQWKDYVGSWSLQSGTYVKLAGWAPNEWSNRIGIVKRPLSKSNQTRVVCDFDGRGMRIPLSWIGFTANSDESSLNMVVKQPVKCKRGDFFAEVAIGDWVIMDRGNKLDVVQFMGI